MTDGSRFRSKSEASAPTDPKVDPTTHILTDLRSLSKDAQQIGRLGREHFLGVDGMLARHAADGILIKVQELCDRLPESFRAAKPEVNWAAIRGTRNRLSHNYRATDHRIVWETITVGLPDLIAQIVGPSGE
ncbi:hypothetical protein BH11ACT3_BH11ACT3_20500 [soil metagenome]